MVALYRGLLAGHFYLHATRTDTTHLLRLWFDEVLGEWWCVAELHMVWGAIRRTSRVQRVCIRRHRIDGMSVSKERGEKTIAKAVQPYDNF